MTLYTLHLVQTSQMHDSQILSFLQYAVAPKFEYFTVINCQGYRKGFPETTVLVQILHDGYSTADTIHSIARQYKKLFKQESVLITRSEVDNLLV